MAIKFGNIDVLKRRIKRMIPFKEKLKEIEINGNTSTFKEPILDLYLHWAFDEPRHRWRNHTWAKIRYKKGFKPNAWKRYYK